MSIEVQIENRLKDTKALLTICAEDHGRIGTIRKGAMRGGTISGPDMKWMVRTLVDVLAFKLNVLELWIEDDQKTLKTGYQEDQKKEPQIPMESAPDVAEATAEPPLEDVKEELEKQEDQSAYVIDEAGLHKEPEPALEGLDRIHQLLN